VKTISLKKVSAVAVASLGFGLLSVVPAQAANGVAGKITAISAKTITATPTANAAVTGNVGLTVLAFTGTVTVAAALTTYPSGGFVSTTMVASGTNGTTSAGASDTVTAGQLVVTDTVVVNGVAAGAAAGNGGFSFTPTVAGTYALTVWEDGGTTPNGQLDLLEARQVVSITVAASATYSNALSSALIIAGNATTDATTTTDKLAVVGAASATAVNTAAIKVVIKDSTATDMTAGNTISASVTGPGYLRWLSTGAAPVAGTCTATPTYSGLVGRTITAQAVDALGYLYVCADGTAGTSTVSISITNADSVSAVLSTKTVTFYGVVTKLAVSSTVYSIGKSGGADTGAATAANLRARTSTNIPAFVVKMTDSADRVANSAAEPTIKSSDVTVVASGLCGLDDNADATYSSGGTGYYNCGFTTASSAKSGDKATLTIRVVDPSGDGTTYLTTTIAVTVGGSIVTEVLSFDKISYAPGEAMVITRTAKDSAGNPVYDGATANLVTFSKAAGGTTPVASKYVGGASASSTSVAKSAVFAPAVAGAFTASMTGGDTAATVRTATATVTDANAALLTQIDALNAKIVALNALIAKIMKKLGVK
jgi:hypothetical protein